MRLTDLDELLKELEEWNADLHDTTAERQLGVTDAIVIACQMPTVDAIPVEWIEKYTEENRLYQSDDFDWYIRDMIADWAERREE